MRILNVSIANINCDDNGTGNDSSDDTYTFEILVTGQNTSSGWISESGAFSGTYGVTQVLGPFLISDGDLTINILDAQNQDCNFETIITPPPPVQVVHK